MSWRSTARYFQSKKNSRDYPSRRKERHEDCRLLSLRMESVVRRNFANRLAQRVGFKEGDVVVENATKDHLTVFYTPLPLPLDAALQIWHVADVASQSKARLQPGREGVMVTVQVPLQDGSGHYTPYWQRRLDKMNGYKLVVRPEKLNDSCFAHTSSPEISQPAPALQHADALPQLLSISPHSPSQRSSSHLILAPETAIGAPLLTSSYAPASQRISPASGTDIEHPSTTSPKGAADTVMLPTLAAPNSLQLSSDPDVQLPVIKAVRSRPDKMHLPSIATQTFPQRSSPLLSSREASCAALHAGFPYSSAGVSPSPSNESDSTANSFSEYAEQISCFPLQQNDENLDIAKALEVAAEAVLAATEAGVCVVRCTSSFCA